MGGVGALWANRKPARPSRRAGGPSLTPAVGGGGGASGAAEEGAWPGAWGRGQGLSVPGPPPQQPRLLTCDGPGDLPAPPPAAHSPGIPNRILPYRSAARR